MRQHGPLFYSVLALWGIAALVVLAANVFGITEQSDFLALIQVVIGVVLVPSAIYGYLSAKASLDASLIQHDLVIEWEVLKIVSPPPDLMSITSPSALDSPTINTQPYRLTPILRNKGTGIVTWFMVNVTLPEAVATKGKGVHHVPIIGKTGQGEWANFYMNGTLNYTFMSHGQVAVYPTWPLRLCDIYLSFDDSTMPTEKLYFEIVTDRGEDKVGSQELKATDELRIVIQEEPVPPSPVGADAAESPADSPASGSGSRDPAAP